ncbi:Conserved_hypothetical protein [Hexamita inflata]|uniref:Uncharacterized protein n=1 Tax=Hexamita inflata TaxID=28002 RepID=A0AA86PY78_9EUKA|nr:Conserved hypothetical protein [Hexamita inflata]
MKLFFKKLFCKQNNPSDTNQSEAPETLYNLSKYDRKMIQKYKSKIQDRTLTIQWDPDLKSLDFIRLLKLNKLVLEDCYNIIQKLESSTIKKLEISGCEIQAVKDFKLENLEVLEVSNFDDYLELNALAQEIVQFKKLKELILKKIITDFSPLSQLIGLTKLCLWSCELRSTEALRPLINLEELCLNYNNVDITTVQYLTKLTKLSFAYCNLVDIDVLRPLKKLKVLDISNNEIDITSVQYLTNLTNLSLKQCNLVSIDILRPLKKLEELNLFNNKIVYLQPLIEMKQLSRLIADSNKIKDIEAIQLHINFDNFFLDDQDEPTKEDLQTANMMRNIQNPITFFRQINKKPSHIKEIQKKITQKLQQSYYNHEQFVALAVQLFQKMNVFDGYK